MVLTIIIGLPCSGKTYYSNSLTNTIIYDDFISNFYNGLLINDIELKKNICINDPRLCDYNIFIRYISIFETYLNKNDIKIVLFKNEPEKCKKNINTKNVLNTIEYYTTKYDLNNYNLYDNIILDVYEK